MTEDDWWGLLEKENYSRDAWEGLALWLRDEADDPARAAAAGQVGREGKDPHYSYRNIPAATHIIGWYTRPAVREPDDLPKAVYAKLRQPRYNVDDNWTFYETRRAAYEDLLNALAEGWREGRT